MKEGAIMNVSPNLERFPARKEQMSIYDSRSFEHKGQREPFFKKATLSRVSSRFLLVSHKIKDILGRIDGFHITEHQPPP